MTMGPEPVLRMVEMAVPFGIIRGLPVSRRQAVGQAQSLGAGDEGGMTLCAGGSMSTLARVVVTIVAAACCFVAPAARAAAPDDAKNRVDWPTFMARHDLVWNRLPTKWGEGAFTGNGLLGAMVYLTDDYAPPSTQPST